MTSNPGQTMIKPSLTLLENRVVVTKLVEWRHSPLDLETWSSVPRIKYWKQCWRGAMMRRWLPQLVIKRIKRQSLIIIMFVFITSQGETPLDVAKAKKNIWISTRIQMIRNERGLDANTSALKTKISSKPVSLTFPLKIKKNKIF